MANQMLSLSEQLEWCFRTTTATAKKQNTTEKIKLVQAAAKLIKDIKAIQTAYEVYPHCNDLTSQKAGIKYLPNALRVLLEELFAGKKAGVKMALIGQAIMQATRLGFY